MTFPVVVNILKRNQLGLGAEVSQNILKVYCNNSNKTVSERLHLHGECPPDGNHDHPLGEVHADEERCLSNIDMERGVNNLNVFVAEDLTEDILHLLHYQGKLAGGKNRL